MKKNNLDFTIIADFEKEIASFFGAPHAIAVDCCTHGIELCLRYTRADSIAVPKNTYISIPFLADKLKIHMEWKNWDWKDYYYLTPSVSMRQTFGKKTVIFQELL